MERGGGGAWEEGGRRKGAGRWLLDLEGFVGVAQGTRAPIDRMHASMECPGYCKLEDPAHPTSLSLSLAIPLNLSLPRCSDSLALGEGGRVLPSAGPPSAPAAPPPSSRLSSASRRDSGRGGGNPQTRPKPALPKRGSRGKGVVRFWLGFESRLHPTLQFQVVFFHHPLLAGPPFGASKGNPEGG